MISGQLDRALAARDGARTDQVLGLRFSIPIATDVDGAAPPMPSDAALAEMDLVVSGAFADADSISVGLGAAVHLQASGPSRFSELRSQLEALWGRTSLVDPTAGPELPRVYGGLSFFSDQFDRRWDGFGDASFVLPRFDVRAQTNVSATIHWYIDAEELSDRLALEREADRVLPMLIRLSTAIQRRLGARTSGPVPSGAWPLPKSDDNQRAAFCQLVDSALTNIKLERFVKVVVARSERLRLGAIPDTLGLLMRLRQAQPNTTQFVFRRGANRFVGATPELLVSLNGTALQTEAVAGSCPISADGSIEQALLSSDKDRREHDWVVKSITRTLADSDVQAVVPDGAPTIRRLRGIAHMQTPVTATVKRGTILDWVERLHPTPALCGYPAAAAAGFIAEREAARGWYGAPMGWVDQAGDGAFVVAIRSALLENDEAHVFAGAGIVRGSVPELEYQETEAKLQSMRGSLEAEKCPAAE